MYKKKRAQNIENPLWLMGVDALPKNQFLKCIKIMKKLGIDLDILCSLTKFRKKRQIFMLQNYYLRGIFKSFLHRP
jgi:hypothetical protein